MARVILLPDEVASQVAAGEVVERPASLVKELVENSIDAESTRIEVAIARGGMSVIRVVDNGMGMDRDDAMLSLERHATSKIRSGLDLARIHTLGFRGEALPSIASVCRFRMATRPHQSLEGTEIVINGGKIESVQTSGEAPGTLIEARSLFYNLPARRKFLRSDNTETSHIQHQLMLQAIGHPGVGFIFVRDQNIVFQVPPSKSLGDRIRDLRGSDLLEQLLVIDEFQYDGVRVSGFIGRAGVSRSTKAEQIFFVNRRPVDNLTIQHGLREGYHTALMKGQFPVTFLFLEMDPETVDVNVHPAKREVRFREPDKIRDAVARAVQRTLQTDRERWAHVFQMPSSQDREEPIKTQYAGPTPQNQEQALIPPAQQFALRKDWAEFQPQFPPPGAPILPASTAPPTLVPVEAIPNLPQSVAPKGSETANQFKIIGILGKLYILMENDQGLVLVDQHAAHERILFEQLRRQMESKGIASQRLLIPLTVQVTPKDYDWMTLNGESLEKMGFILEPFGDSTLKIDGIPQFFRSDDPALAVRQLVDELRSMTTTTSRLRMGEDVIAKTVCRHAIKANDTLRLPEVERLITDLLACELPYCCPHGRPTMIQISHAELEKKFGRKV